LNDTAIFSGRSRLKSERTDDESPLQKYRVEAAPPVLSIDTVFENIPDSSPVDSSTETPQQVATFKIRYILGEGSSGVVYCAEQDYPRRLVALKVLKSNRIKTLHRFKREAQTLARLQHRGIAQIYTAGETKGLAGNTPFLALELVEGRPLTVYASHEKLTIRQRLELFLKVSDAVAYAHERGVIHRDLKPSNILVDAKGEPKILDFGLSQIFSDDEEDASMLTETGQVLGTFAYMSPEQASTKERPDVRADVYALGVIAYELLAGKRPYEPPAGMPLEAIRIICHEDATPLSSIDHRFRGDVDTIIAKALEKQTLRRYQTVAEFAADIRRYLSNEPIRARPASVWYQSSKFILRHKAIVSGTLAVIVALIIGLIATSYEAAVATAKAREAELRLAQSQISQADAFLVAARHEDARKLYLEAWDRFSALHESTLPAELGVWDVDQRLRRPIVEWKAHEGSIHAIAYAPDGLSAASAGEDGIVRVWDLVTGRELYHLSHGKSVWSVALSHDGKYGAFGAVDGTITVWGFATGKELWHKDSESTIITLAFSPDDHVLAWNESDGTMALQNILAPGAPPQKIGAHLGISGLAFSTQGDIATWGSDSAVRIWSSSGTLLQTIPKQDTAISNIAFTSDGRNYATMDSSGHLCLRDTKGEMIRTFNSSPANQLIFSDPNSLLSINGSGLLSILDISTGKIHEHISMHEADVIASSPDGHGILEGRKDGILALWNVAPPLGRVQFSGHDKLTSAVAISPDGHIFLSGGNDRRVCLWDTQTGYKLDSHEVSSEVSSVAFSPSGDEAYAGLTDGSIIIWSLLTHQQVGVLNNSPGLVSYLLPLPDGKTLLAGSNSSTDIKIWSISDHRAIGHYTNGLAPVQCLALQSDGSIFSGNDDGSIQLWHDENTSPTAMLRHASNVTGMVLIPGTERMVTASEDSSIRIWNTVSNTVLQTFPAHTGPVMSLTRFVGNFSVASAGQNGELRIWDISNRSEIRQFDDTPPFSTTIASTPDGYTIAAGRENGTIRLWRFDRPVQERNLMKTVPDAFHAAQTGKATAADLLIMGKWFNFCGTQGLAAEAYHRAQHSGAAVSPLTLARCFAAAGDTKRVKQELRAAKTPASDRTLVEKLWFHSIENGDSK